MTAVAFSTPAPAPNGQGAPIYVHPGRTVISTDGTALTTAVGSGLALCLWDPFHGVGGMAHFLLPEAGAAPPAPRYGNVAMVGLVEELKRAGASPASLRARLYGGCAPPIGSVSGHIGDRNVAAALVFLRSRAIPIVDRDTGGVGARKIVFGPKDGGTEVVRIGAPAPAQSASRDPRP